MGEPEVKATRGFPLKVAEAEAAIGKDNILEPAKAKEFIDANAQCLLLDVQDPGSDMVPGSYNASLGTLFFKASTDLPEFKDPKIADRPKDAPILVNCALGGQAKLGAKILIDYGFTNVKVIDGGCVAWKKADLGSVSPCSEVKGEDTKAGFLAKVSEAEAAIKPRNILDPEKAKMYMDMPSSACLLWMCRILAAMCFLVSTASRWARSSSKPTMSSQTSWIQRSRNGRLLPRSW